MPEFVIKPQQGRDEYVLWSTIVDAPIGYGNRARMLADLENRWRWDHPHADPKPGYAPIDRLDRADRTGTSVRDGDYGWNDTKLLYEQRGWLHRRDLYRAAELLATGREAELERLLEPFGED